MRSAWIAPLVASNGLPDDTYPMAFTAPASADFAPPGSQLSRDVTAAPVHRGSTGLVAALVTQTAMRAPNFNCTQYGLPIYEVDDDVAPVTVDWPGHTMLDMLYAGLLGVNAESLRRPSTISAATLPPGTRGPFWGVPLPDGAKAATGTDAALAIYKPSTGELWEFWRANQDPTTRRWSALWGGYIPDIHRSAGFYSGDTGVCASGLIDASIIVRINEVRAGAIGHAISLALPAVTANIFSYPAQRTDGQSTAAHAIPEGTRFRLKASVDVNNLLRPPDWAGRRYPIHPIGKMIARAAQKYGFIVSDVAGVVAIGAEEGTATMLAQTARGETPVNPWTGAKDSPGLLGGRATWDVLVGFPWGQLEALPANWGKSA